MYRAVVSRVVGRRVELAAVRAAVGRLASGHGGVLTIEGAAGSGKTTLLDELVAIGGAHDVRTVSAGITLAEQPIAWAGLATVLDGLLGGAEPGSTVIAAPALRRAVGREAGPVVATEVAFALSGLIEQVCTSAPIALVVDDVHWLDAATAGALAMVIRKAPRLPLLVVLARRSDEPIAAGVDVARLVPGAAHEHIALGGISRGETATLVRAASGRVLDRATLVRIFAETGGNPLHVLEVSRRLAGGTPPEEAVSTRGLSASLAERIAATSEECAAVLLTAALAATPTLHLLARAHPDLDVESAVGEAERRQIATVADGEHRVLRFNHPLLPAAAAAVAGPVERARRHRLLAGLVEGPQERALHLAAGTLRPDEQAAAELTALGDELLVRAAPAEAAAAFRRAAELTPAADARDRRALQAGSALVRAGDYVGAVGVLTPLAAGSTDQVVRATASVEVVLPTAHAGSLADAADAAERALELMPDPATRGQLLRWLVRLQQLVDGPVALTTAARALDEARQSGNATLLHAAVGVFQNAKAFAGEPIDLAAATAAARSWVDRIAADSPPAMLAELMQWCDLPDAAKWLQQYMGATAGSAGERRNVDGLMSSYLLRAGRWDEAETMLRRIADDDALSATANLPFQLADLMWLGAQRGHDVGDLRAVLSSMVDMLPPLASVQVLSRLGGVALAAGDVTGAAADLSAARTRAVRMSLHSVRVLPFRLELVEALLAAGDVAAATAEADALGRDADRSAIPSAHAEAAAAAAMVAASGRRATGAADRFDQALTLYGALDLPFDEARVRLAAGVAARRQGKRTRAIAHLDAAAEAFRLLGAAPWAARASAERDRVGDRAVPKGALTPSEQRIAELVAAGQTNAEVAAALFVSLRTVESNLTRVYRKFGVRSRVQLAARLRDG